MIYNYVHSEMKREILQQWHKSIPWWIGKEQIKIVSSLLYIMRIWTNIFPWCTVLFAGGRLGMGSPVGVWFPLFLCIISYAVHVPTVSKGPRFPFQCGPRDTEHCLKYSNWDTQPHSPNKRRCKDKGIIGLNPEMNILLDIHNSVSISSQKMVRPWHKKHALSHELFLFSFFCLPIFAPPPFSDTQ